MCVPKDKARILMEGEEHKYTAFQLIYEIFHDDMCLILLFTFIDSKAFENMHPSNTLVWQ